MSDSFAKFLVAVIEQEGDVTFTRTLYGEHYDAMVRAFKAKGIDVTFDNVQQVFRAKRPGIVSVKRVFDEPERRSEPQWSGLGSLAFSQETLREWAGWG